MRTGGVEIYEVRVVDTVCRPLADRVEVRIPRRQAIRKGVGYGRVVIDDEVP